MAIRVSQVEKAARRSKSPILVKALTKLSCAAASASAEPTYCRHTIHTRR